MTSASRGGGGARIPPIAIPIRSAGGGAADGGSGSAPMPTIDPTGSGGGSPCGSERRTESE